MYELEIRSSSENYKVSIGIEIENFFDDFDFAVIDANLRERFNSVTTHVLFLEAVENDKSLATVEIICEAMRASNVRRDSKILAIGGGVIQDLVTLAASLYMRGISWAYSPTTMTGILDSCLGGKSSINVQGTKNLIGNIYPPNEILIDPTFVDSLPVESIVSGLAEGVKISFAKGRSEFIRFMESSYEIEKFKISEKLIYETLQNKKWFIEVDEHDKAERQLLNFGHSFGHAIETAVGFNVQHGTGVALGMLAAITHPKSFSTEWGNLLEQYCLSILSPLEPKLSILAGVFDPEKFRSALRSDKKNTKDSLCLILPSSESPLAKVYLPFNQGAVDTALESVVTTLSRFTKN